MKITKKEVSKELVNTLILVNKVSLVSQLKKRLKEILISMKFRRTLPEKEDLLKTVLQERFGAFWARCIPRLGIRLAQNVYAVA